MGEHISLGICVPTLSFLPVNKLSVSGKGEKIARRGDGGVERLAIFFPKQTVHRLLLFVLNHYANFLLYYIRIYYIVKPFPGDYDTTPSPFYLVQHKVPIESVAGGIWISRGLYESQPCVVNSLM